MPTYLIHGFRWPRPLIRVHVILNDLEDAAPDWLMAPGSSKAFKDSLTALHSSIMAQLPSLRFIEQHDPLDEAPTDRTQPFAFVADIVHEVNLSVEVDEVRGKGVKNEAWEAMLELRDKLAPGEKVAWYVVYCGDTERDFPSSTGSEIEDEAQYAHSQAEPSIVRSDKSGHTSRNDSTYPVGEKKKSRLAKLFGTRGSGGLSLRRSKSNKPLNGSAQGARDGHPEHVPSLPNARQTEAYEQRNLTDSRQSRATTTASEHQQLLKSPQSAISPTPPRAGILPSPAASALPSPAFPPHPATSVPVQPAAAPELAAERGTSIDSRVSSTTASSRPATATRSTKQSAKASSSKDLPIRQRLPVATDGK